MTKGRKAVLVTVTWVSLIIANAVGLISWAFFMAGMCTLSLWCVHDMLTRDKGEGHGNQAE